MSHFADKKYDVCVIGGGFSGLVLAILCARAGLLVCILEKSDTLGRKILSTGNGRCNFTNSDMDKSNFFSSYKDLDINIDYRDSISFFNSIGVIENNIDGYFYPITNQAKTIQNALINEINHLKIDTYINQQAKRIEKQTLYTITTAQNNKITSDNVVIATGGLSAPKLGSNGDGLYIAKTLGLNVIECVPGLVGLKSSDSSLAKIAGVRAQCSISYKSYNMTGEIQFNKDGISGYPVMCISRHISYDLKDSTQTINIDFIPFLTEPQLEDYFEERLSNQEFSNYNHILNGLINEKIIEMLLSQNSISSVSDTNTKFLIKQLKQYEINITDTKGYDFSQVTAGGIDLTQIDLKSMMVKTPDLKNLYFIGEILDVDGICGGYNLEWARYSANLAASNIIQQITGK